MIIIAGALIWSLLVGIAANARGRSGIGWFLLCLVITPLLAIILLLVLPNLRHEKLLQAIAGTRPEAPSPLTKRGGKLRHHALFGGKTSRVTVDRRSEQPV